eukprot:GHRR01001500.1.p1 GENE.GHRR01001500.1~~GHRR01001500.1.p1  ORF type:complete len:249 (+),score=64.79 GHRR01001500.1:166-912(+)
MLRVVSPGIWPVRPYRRAMTLWLRHAASDQAVHTSMSNKIQLYSLATPNGQKIGVALEELGLPYDTHVVDIRKGDQSTADYKKVNPNAKIPAIIDPDGPGGKPLTLFESGAILLYLAEKAGKLLPADPAARYETIAWLMWQMAGVGPMFGQFNHFTRYAPEEIPYAVDRYTKESKRLLGVLESRLADGRQYIMGDEYTIADIATFTWVKAVKDALGVEELKAVSAWLERCLARPATKAGLQVAAFPSA